MIRIYDEETEAGKIFNREIIDYPEFESTVKKIVADVRDRGDGALFEYSEKFDGVRIDPIEVSDAEIKEAFGIIDPELKDTIEEARANIEAYHSLQKRKGFRMEKSGGIVLGQKITPIEKVGIYVPGGTASYPSTVLMNAIPAKIAGVSEIIMVTPTKTGKIKPEILVAAKLCGVTRIFKCGGAQAIAALAYGTSSIPKVDKIVGPGNIFVALAKKQVFGVVDIDMIAGPSEILVVADGNAEPSFVAADLLSQAEHDKLASAVLVTCSRQLADKVSEELEKQIPKLARADIARASIDTNGKIIVVESVDRAIDIANLIAPEHLELYVNEPFSYLDKVKNAGSVFLGKYSPEPLGDYFAGPNHTLPTGGSARFSSALSVDDFVKKTQYIYYPESELEKASGKIAGFARAEGLGAHAAAVEIRFKKD